MVRRRSNTPKMVMIRDRQFWSWAKISLPRDQKDDIISRLMDRLYAEGHLNMDLRPSHAQREMEQTIASQIELMPAAFRALHARREKEMQRRLRLMATARKRYYLAARRSSPRRGGASQRGRVSQRGGASQRGASQRGGRTIARIAQHATREQQQQQKQESEQQEDDPMEGVQQEGSPSRRRSVPWSSDSSSEEDTSPREPSSPVLQSSTPEGLEEPKQMDLDALAPAPQTPTYETPRPPVDSSLNASPASPPPVTPPANQGPAWPSIIPDEIQSTQPENLSAEERSALRSGQLLEPYEPARSQAPGPETPRRGTYEESEVSTEVYSTPEDAMRKNLHPDENYDDISSEDTSGGVPGASRIEVTPRETGTSTRDPAEEHPSEHSEKHQGDNSEEEGSEEEDSEDEDSEEEDSDEENPEEENPEEESPEEESPEEENPEEENPEEENPEEEHPDEKHPEEQQPQEQHSQKAKTPEPPEDDLEDYNSDGYAAEGQSHLVTPRSQGQGSQGQVSPEQYSQEQFTRYRHSGYESSRSDSPTEKAPSPEPSPDEGQVSHAVRDPNSYLRDDTIFAYASESSIEESTEFYIHQLASLVPDPPINDLVFIDSVRFDYFQELLRPLNYNPARHDIYYLNATVNGQDPVVVDSARGIVSALLMMQLRDSPIEFFLRKKNSEAE